MYRRPSESEDCRKRLEELSGPLWLWWQPERSLNFALMRDGPVAIEESPHGNKSIMSVVLRRMCDAVAGPTFGGRTRPAASFAPGNSLLAVHSESGDVKMYTMFYYGEVSGHVLPGFSAASISSFAWVSVVPSTTPIFVALSSQKRKIIVYQFLKSMFGQEEDVHLHTQAANQQGKFFLRFQTEKALQEDCNVVEYSLSFSTLFDSIKSRYPSLQAIGTCPLRPCLGSPSLLITRSPFSDLH